MKQTTANNITLDQIKDRMAADGLSFQGSYSNLPETIYHAIDTVNLFGWQYWVNKTTTGPAIKKVVAHFTNTSI